MKNKRFFLIKRRIFNVKKNVFFFKEKTFFEHFMKGFCKVK